MGEIVPFAEKMKVLQGDLGRYEERLDTVLPRGMDVQRFVAVVQNEVQRNPELLDCQRGTVVGCVVQAAELGLEFGAKQHAHLIPRRIKGQLRCTLLIDYRGLVHLSMKGGGVRAVWAHVVREGDSFTHQLGDNPSVQHVPNLKRPPANDDSDVVAAYAVMELANGRKLLEVLPRWELDKVRASAQSKSGPWSTWFGRMARKTALKRVCNLPAATGTAELSEALRVDDAQELDRTPVVVQEVEAEIQRTTDHAAPSWSEDAAGDQRQPPTDKARTGDPGASDAPADSSPGNSEDGPPWWQLTAKGRTKLHVAQHVLGLVLGQAGVDHPEDLRPDFLASYGDKYQAVGVMDLPQLDMAMLRELLQVVLDAEDAAHEGDELPEGGGS